MKLKNKIITFIICAIILCLYFIRSSYNNLNIDKIYNVYLDGKIIGSITNKEKLYNLIDEKQQGIKDKYNVSNVYPPSSLEVIENYSYNTKISNLNDVYDKIEELQDFTIKGYEIQISKTEDHDDFYIYVLDEDILKEAIRSFILVFISEEDLNNYMNRSQVELDDVGLFYDKMGIDEDIIIREKYISVNNKIYENSSELAQELLFGFNYKESSYTIKAGDTIESISEDNSLNTQEFLIANPKYISKDSLLSVGDKVNITLINPEISFTYLVSQREEKEYKFETEVKRDNTKDPSYYEITQPGINGLYLETRHYSVTNGEQSTQVDFDESIPIRETVNQIVTKGRTVVNIGSTYENDTGVGWKWPTASPYIITSNFEFRWGRHHNGIDISGAETSNIYAVAPGTVIKVVNSCPNYGTYGNTCGSGFGNHVVIDHGNGIYTTYAHMTNNVAVSVGQNVGRASVLGHMGRSGSSTGVHLHFGVSVGNVGNYVNPKEYLFR